MSESLELVIHVKVDGQEKIDSVVRSMTGVGDQAKRSSAGLDQMNKSVAEVTRGFGNFDGILGRLPGSLGSVAAALGPLGVGFGLVTVGLGTAAAAMWTFAKETGELAEAQLNMAERTGMTVKEVGLFSAVAQNAGVNAEAFTGTMRTLSHALSENSEEGKKAKKALGELGIDARNQFGGLKGTADLFLEIGDAMQRIEDPAKRARLAVDLLGRGGLELLPVFRSNLREAVKEVEGLGVAFDESGAKSAARFDDALDRLMTRLGALRREAGSASAEILQSLFPETFDSKDPKTGKYYSQLKRDEYNRHLQEVARDAAVAYNGGTLSLTPEQLRAGLKFPLTPTAPSTADLESQKALSEQQRKEAEEAAREAGKKIRAREAQFQRLLDALNEQGLDPLARLIASTTARLRELTAEGPMTEGQRARMEASLQGAIRRQLASRKIETVPSDLFMWGGLPTVANTAEVDPKVTEKALADARNRVVKALQRQVSFQERLIQLTTGPGGELDAINRIADMRERSARREFEITKDQAKLDADLDEARKNRLLSIAELQKRSVEQYREAAGRVFDAMTANGGGGIRDWITGQLKIQERQIFMNLSAGLFRQIGSTLGKAGEASGLGGLLNGTIFDPKNAKLDKALSQAEIVSRDRNTVAVDNLTVAIQSAATSGAFSGGADLGGVAGAGGGSGPASSTTAVTKAGLKSWQKGIGIAGAAAGGALGVWSGVQEGGARGAVTAGGSLAGAAGTILSLAGVSGPAAPILMGFGLGLGFVRSLFPDPKKQREEEITRTLQNARYNEPVAMERSVDLVTGGTFDYDYRGRARSGGVTNINLQVSAMDAKSILDRSDAICLAVRKGLQDGSPLGPQIQQTVGANL
jgi:hypothetical protein